jgi:hypothetical protein
MLRRLVWLNQDRFRGWACSACAWKFNPSDPLVGTSIDEMKRRYEGNVIENLSPTSALSTPERKGSRMLNYDIVSRFEELAEDRSGIIIFSTVSKNVWRACSNESSSFELVCFISVSRFTVSP